MDAPPPDNAPESTLAQQVQALQQQLTAVNADNERLQAQITRQQAHILRLSHWLQGLQRDIQDVYNSVTWLLGSRLTRLILAVLRRPPGPTARDHVERVRENFQHWQQQFFSESDNATPLSFVWHEQQEYARWIAQQEGQSAEPLATLQRSVEQNECPCFSLLMRVAASSPQAGQLHRLQQAIASVQTQSYAHWQLYVLIPERHRQLIQSLHDADDRIHVLISASNGCMTSALNQVLQTSVTGEFCALIEGDDQLTPHALSYFAAHLQQTAPQPDIIYSDSDRLDAAGQRCEPEFKPDWNPDLFLSRYYFNNLTLIRTALLKKIAGFSADYPRYEVYDSVLKLLAQQSTLRITHIPHVLYHQRQIPPPDPAVAYQALNAHLQHTQPDARATLAAGDTLRVHYPLPKHLPLVSIIIPTRDKVELLRDTVTGVLQATDYANVQLIILDNGSVQAETLAYLNNLQADSRVTVIKDTLPFNYSRLNNCGVRVATGEVVALLNNDLAMLHPDWLSEMVSHALRPEVGAVGAKLYYPDDSLQHAGVIVGLGGMAGHAFKHVPKRFAGYQWRPFATQNYSAVTAACLVMRRVVFNEVGGLDEKNLPVAFNDVDLCLKIGAAGYRIVWTPYAELYHRESASRGADTSPRKFFRLQRELRYMRQRWGAVIAHDPCYNPNLTLQYEDFSLRWKSS